MVLFLTSGFIAFSRDRAWGDSPELPSREWVLARFSTEKDGLVDIRLAPLAAIAAPTSRMVVVRESSAHARYDAISRQLHLSMRRHGMPSRDQSAEPTTECRTLYRLGIVLQT